MAMNLTSTSTTTGPDCISQLQNEAWAAANAAYGAEEAELYREVSRALYLQDVRERISALEARSDAQNALLDEMLLQRAA